MAKISFNDLSQDTSATSGTSNNQVSFFNLADGEEAIVRILIDSTDDFDIHTIHNVEMQGYQYGRKMNCLRNPLDPIEACPLCAAGKKLDQKLFIRIIQYTIDNQTNTLIPTAKIWERGVRDRKFGTQALKSYLDTYGPLSDIICKITRTGTGLNTEYTPIFGLNIMPNTKERYKDEFYIKDTTIFGDYSPLGGAILNKTANEYAQFLLTGSFPQTNNQQNIPQPQVTPRTYEQTPVNNVPPMNTAPTYPQEAPAANYAYTSPQQAYNTPTQENVRPTMPWETPNNVPNAGGFERPRRY